MTHPKPGRPRSEETRRHIMQAVQEMLTEQGGSAMTMESVARRAGVGKQTLYRWWPSLADIVLEMSLDYGERTIPAPDTGALESDLRKFLRLTMAAASSWNGAHLRLLMAHAQKDEEFLARLKSDLIIVRRQAFSVVLQAAMDRGEISRDIDLEFVADMVYGPMWYRLQVGHAPLDTAFADKLARSVLAYVT
mgnify:FL=1